MGKQHFKHGDRVRLTANEPRYGLGTKPDHYVAGVVRGAAGTVIGMVDSDGDVLVRWDSNGARFYCDEALLEPENVGVKFEPEPDQVDLAAVLTGDDMRRVAALAVARNALDRPLRAPAAEDLIAVASWVLGDLDLPGIPDFPTADLGSDYAGS